MNNYLVLPKNDCLMHEDLKLYSKCPWVRQMYWFATPKPNSTESKTVEGLIWDQMRHEQKLRDNWQLAKC